MKLPASIPGVNIHEAMKELQLDEDTFIYILDGFVRTNQNTAEAFKRLLAEKKWSALRDLAHSVKGSSANIRAQKLQSLSYKLEQDSKNECVNEDEVTIWIGALNEVMTSIRALTAELAPSSASPEDHAPLDVAALAPVLANIRAAIDDSDPKKINQYFDEIKSNVDHPLVLSLENQLSDYDYEDALETIEALAAQLGITL